MAGANPDMIIRIAANIAELRQNLKQGLDQIETTTAGMTKLAQSLDGSKLIQRANNIVAAVREVGGVTKLTEAEQTRLNQTLDAAIKKYDALGTHAPTAIKNLKAELDAATQSTATSTSALGKLDGALGMVGLSLSGLSLAGVAGGLISFGKEAIDAAGHIVDLSAQTGLSTAAIQQYGYIAANTGTSVDAFTNAIFKMGVNLETGGLQVEHGMRAIGMSLADIQALKPEEQFDRIMRSLAAIIDPQERNRVGVEFMGKAYQQVAGSVSDYIDLMDRAPVASEASIRSIDAAADAAASAWTRAKTAAIDAIGQVVLTVENLKSFKNVTVGGLAQSFAQTQGSLAAANVMANSQSSAAVPAAASDAVVTYTERLRAATSEINNLTSAQRTEIDNALKLGESMNDIATRFHLSTDAQHLYAGVERDAAAAAKAHADEVDKLNKKLADEAARMQAMVTQGFVTTQALEGFASSMKKMQQALSLPQYGDAISTAEHGLSVLMANNSSPNALANAVKYMPRVALPKPPKAGEDIGVGLGNALSSAIQGGGNVVAAGGAFLGGELGKHLSDEFGSTLTSMLGKTVGGAINAVLPGVGTLLGSLASKAISGLGKLFGIGTAGRDLVQQFADSMGGFDALHDKLDQIGDSGEQLWKTLTQGVGSNNPKQAQAAIDQVNAALTQFNQTQLDVQDKFSSLLDAVNEFGGKAPKQLQPMIEQLLQMQGLTEEQQQLLKDMLGDPSMDALQDAADTLGVTFDHMGQQFKAAQIDKTAFTYQHALDTLRDSGADMNGVLMDSKDKINELVDQAMEAGAALPDTMKPYIQKLIDMGQLVAPDGTLVTNIDQLSFADIPDSSLDAIKTILGQIRDLLKKDIPEAAGYAQSALDAVHMPADVSPGPNYVREGGQWVYYPTPEAADAARISQNRNANAGQMPHLADGGFVMRPTVALIGESGPEAVVPLSRGNQLVGAGVTIVNHVYPSRGMSERELAQMVAKRIPDELRKAGY